MNRFYRIACIAILPVLFTLFLSAIVSGGRSYWDLIQPDPQDELLIQFQQLHEQILSRIHEGDLPSETAENAAELKHSLEKELIRLRAELDVLKLDALHGPEQSREAAIKTIMKKSAQNESLKQDYLRRLRALGASNSPPAPVVGERSADTALETTKKEEGIKWSTRNLDIEIEIAPEDIYSTDHE